jgi:hypothetical protein
MVSHFQPSVIRVIVVPSTRNAAWSVSWKAAGGDENRKEKEKETDGNVVAQFLGYSWTANRHSGWGWVGCWRRRSGLVFHSECLVLRRIFLFQLLVFFLQLLDLQVFCIK